MWSHRLVSLSPRAFAAPISFTSTSRSLHRCTVASSSATVQLGRNSTHSPFSLPTVMTPNPILRSTSRPISSSSSSSFPTSSFYSSSIYPSITSTFSYRSTASSPAMTQSKQLLGGVRGMANHRHKKMIKRAKGYRGRANSCFTVAKQRVEKAFQYAYRDRKVKKREFRKLWIQRINAAGRMYGVPYASLVNCLSRANIILNRKVLSEMATQEPLSFKGIVEVALSTATPTTRILTNK